MASKARNADDLLKDLDELGFEDVPSSKPDTASKPNKRSTTATNASAEDDEDVFGDIQKQLASKAPAAGSSRPVTPRLSSSTTTGTNKSPKRGSSSNAAADHTPASSGPPSGRTSEDRLRLSGDKRPSGERSYHRASTPGAEHDDVSLTEEKKTESAGGGWWGSMFSAATAAVKQAETLAKEIRGNEEAMKWAEQVRGYGAGLQNLSTDLRSRALPTFTSLISHIAPPISAHERLQIHITHDILNYPSLDPLIYDTFSRIMVQVEGGDLMVIQRGSESRGRASSELQGYRGGMLSAGTRWTDGPWWRDENTKRDLGVVAGLREGTRLARVSAESYAKEFFDARGGVEEAAKKATETLSDSNPTRSSDIFLAIQAVSYTADTELFTSSSTSAAAAAAGQQKQDAAASTEESGVTIIDDSDESDSDLVAFAIHLHDPLHSLSFSTLSQPFPQKWATWLDATTGSDGDAGSSTLPASIQEIIQSGGVDPREWIAEWTEEVLGLAVGVLAQRYVARRMGVGEGGLARGKKRAEETGVGGEAARAI